MLLRTPPQRHRPALQPDSESPDRKGGGLPSLQRRLWEKSSMPTPYHHTINVPSPPKRTRYADEEATVLNTPLSQQLLSFGAPTQTLLLQDGGALVCARPGLESEEEEGHDLPVDWDSLRCSYKCTNLVKSELVETLQSQAKRLVELERNSKSLKALLDAAESEKKISKQRIVSLEQTLAAAGAREKALQSQRVSEADKAEEVIRQQMRRYGELQARFQDEMAARVIAEAAESAAAARAVSAESAKEKLAQAAAKEQSLLREQLDRLKKDNDYVISKLKSENVLEKQRGEGALAVIQVFEGRVEDLQKSLAEHMEQKRELEHKLFNTMGEVATTRTISTLEAESVIKHLRQELTLSSADVVEARKMKQINTNIELLKEKLESERQRAERAESALANLVDMELRIAELECEVELWKDAISRLPGVTSREDVLPKFAQLKQEVEVEIGRTRIALAQVSELRSALKVAEAAKLEAHANAEAALGQVADVNNSLQKLERKLTLVSKERDGYKAIIASYDEEESMIMSHQKPGSAIADLALPEKAKQQRIQELETALEDARKHTESLEQGLESTSRDLKTALVEVENLTKRLKEAQDKIQDIEGCEDQLRSEIAIYESKIGRGDFNPATTKVLHLLSNPEVGADKQRLQLQAEVEALKIKLKAVEHGRSPLGSYPSDECSPNQNKEIHTLTQRVTSLEKREARYRQVFADKIAAFREACYLLFGYTVKMTEQQDPSGLPLTLLTLRSKYAQSDEEELEFQYSSGCVNILENDYTNSPDLAPQLNTFLRKWNCIPAFTANLTIESFNKVTMG